MDSGKGTYVAFDELCQKDADQSDFRFCLPILRWAAERPALHMVYEERHDKVYAVRKSSLRASLTTRIKERLATCHNVVVVLSSETRKSGSILSYEIEEAVDSFGLPLIITYVDFKAIAEPLELEAYWPNALSQRIKSGAARAIHIPFNKHAILDAVSQFTSANRPLTGVNHYTEYAHRKFKCITDAVPFGNCKRESARMAGH
ncbi:MAG: hypothetical protein HGB00_07565 [Chlorobiaceae bacterium]|nr:hypothetical protein [Chlorobiaceae bacterium]